MKKVWLACLMSSVTTLSYGAEPQKPKPQWFQCTVDAECVNVEYFCAKGVVNKAYAKLADEYYSVQNAVTNCTRDPGVSQKKEPYKVYCEASVCKVRGVNPKPGFS